MIKFIDLFAGIGATRLGFEQACKELGIKCKCVFTSEIKDYAVKVYTDNFPKHKVFGDITQIDAISIPDFDFLLGGFPCQAFSAAGSRKGFGDTRGTLFFEIERILKEKQPTGFLLENVEGLVNHDNGRTLATILNSLTSLGYKTTYKILNSADFGVAQSRKRIYIIGRKDRNVTFDNLTKKQDIYIKDIQEIGKDLINSNFTKKLLSHFEVRELYGKSIKDKRGGEDNIHSWDLAIKGQVSKEQKMLLNTILTERRKKHRAIKKGIKRMDGMPLTLEEICSFYGGSLFCDKDKVKDMLDDLLRKGYLAFEHPKQEIVKIDAQGNKHSTREQDTSKEKGYNIVAGKLSFPITKILHPEGYSPTIVATDATRIGLIDGSGIRNLTILEGKRLFGLPDGFKMDISYSQAFDLLGNTVVVPVIKEVSKSLLS